MRKSPPVQFGSMAASPPMAGRGQKIGLLGGSFNPPHAAHVLISEIALKRLKLDHVWWLVTPGNPLKPRSELLPLEERAEACRAMLTDPRIVVTTFEKDLPTAYTAATLDFLRLRRPDASFVWVMGADCLAQFHRWHRWRHIFALMPIAVVDRPGWRLSAMSSPSAHAFERHRVPETKAAELATMSSPAWTLLTGPLSPLSSTQLRRNRAK